ncbi:hypothetical protein ACIBCN_21675 [Nocardia sp. NPDC051052]|uniref:hypothetical protein n=1 Tax=Nocardia sp. NPDC051052 TaxID=3364322 RepID=UPI0037A14E05
MTTAIASLGTLVISAAAIGAESGPQADVVITIAVNATRAGADGRTTLALLRRVVESAG